MKKLLLVTMVAGGLMFAGPSRSDAGVYFSVGFGFPGYYGYYPYGYYGPYYRGYYYRPYYWRHRHRYYRQYPNY